MANQKTLKLTIAKVDGPIFDGEVISVTIPGTAGEMTILPNHSSLISPLKKGTITVRTGTENFKYEIESGTFEISENKATLLI